MRWISRRLALVCTSILIALAGSACATREPLMLAPPNTQLARIEAGMSELEVRDLLGEPNLSHEYEIWNAWNPFYEGRDTARTDWVFTDIGRVVFARNRYSGHLSVIAVDYDPSPDD